MKTALEILGIKSYHSAAWYTGQQRDAHLWNEAVEAKYFGQGPPFDRREWDALLGAYGGVSADAPLCGFAEELIAAYPEAKVVVERDVESWFRSFDMTAGRVLLSPTINLVARCDPAFLGPVWGCYRRWTRGQMGADTLAELRANARQRYRDHYAHVRQVTPPERLLEFDLKDGWEPLCRFLGREVPNVPFPRVNDGNYMVKGVWTVVTFRVIAVLLKICLWVVPVVVAMVGWRLYGKGD